jgi:hypothetical protein
MPGGVAAFGQTPSGLRGHVLIRPAQCRQTRDILKKRTPRLYGGLSDAFYLARPHGSTLYNKQYLDGVERHRRDGPTVFAHACKLGRFGNRRHMGRVSGIAMVWASIGPMLRHQQALNFQTAWQIVTVRRGPAACRETAKRRGRNELIHADDIIPTSALYGSCDSPSGRASRRAADDCITKPNATPPRRSLVLSHRALNAASVLVSRRKASTGERGPTCGRRTATVRPEACLHAGSQKFEAAAVEPTVIGSSRPREFWQ